AHRKTVVRGKARFLATGYRPRGRGLSPGRRSARLSRPEAGRGVGVPAAPTSHQPVYLALRPNSPDDSGNDDTPRVSFAALGAIRHDLLGHIQPKPERIASVCRFDARDV